LGGDDYSFTLGSDVVRDGMFLEMEVGDGDGQRTIAEIFYSDETGKFFLNCFEQNVSLELIEHLIAEGRKRLPPSTIIAK
jgi:hypothetical protein